MTDLIAPAVHCFTCQDTGRVPAAFALPEVGALILRKPCPAGCPRPFALGNVVRVRDETWLSIITSPDGKPSCDPSTIAVMDGICCVPVAIVRPHDDPDGALRWVEQTDLTHAELAE